MAVHRDEQWQLAAEHPAQRLQEIVEFGESTIQTVRVIDRDRIGRRQPVDQRHRFFRRQRMADRLVKAVTAFDVAEGLDCQCHAVYCLTPTFAAVK